MFHISGGPPAILFSGGLLEFLTSSMFGVVARAGLGPSPGWGPVRVGALMGPYMGPYGPLWVLLDRSWRSCKIPYTFRKLSVETFGQISHVSGPKLVF